MKRIAILSDTHGLLRPQVLEHLKTADAILHAGDLDNSDILDELRDLGKDLYVVRGNNDWDWALSIRSCLTVTIDGVTFFMVHNPRDVPRPLPAADVVVCGHTHKYSAEERDGVLWLNPGSCGPRRFYQEVTMAMMEVAHGAVVRVTEIPLEGK